MPGTKAEGTKDPDLDKGLPPKNARYMSNVQELLWCDARNEHGCVVNAPDCDPHGCFVVHWKKQETNTGGKAKMLDQYKCTITCAFCGKRKQYKDECYHKQCLSALPKSETQNGSGKGNADKDKGKDKSKGRGKGQEKGKSGRGVPDRKPDKDKNQDKSAGNPNPTPEGNPEPCGGQPNPGPTTHSQTQAEQEQGAKRGN